MATGGTRKAPQPTGVPERVYKVNKTALKKTGSLSFNDITSITHKEIATGFKKLFTTPVLNKLVN